MKVKSELKSDFSVISVKFSSKEKRMKNEMSVYDYISIQPVKVAANLRKIRKMILSVVPEAEESISYGMPAYKFHGPIAYFAVFKNHIGFFPTPSGVRKFQKDLSKYEYSKGGIKFSFDNPIPFRLIKMIVKYKLHDNLSKLKKIKK